MRSCGRSSGPAAALAEAGIKVAALSVDDEPATAELIAKHGLTFPVGYSADARAIAGLTGAFVNPGPVYLQSTGFVLDPAGQVVVSVYSSGAHRPARPGGRDRPGPLPARARDGLTMTSRKGDRGGNRLCR